MRIVIQRANGANVVIEGRTTAEFSGLGYVILLGIEATDTLEDGHPEGIRGRKDKGTVSAQVEGLGAVNDHHHKAGRHPQEIQCKGIAPGHHLLLALGQHDWFIFLVPLRSLELFAGTRQQQRYRQKSKYPFHTI